MNDLDLVNVNHMGDRTEIRLAGRLGVSDTVEAHRRLDAALTRNRPISLDAANLSGVDTAGLQLLVAFYLAAHARGLNPHWTHASPALREGATLLGLEVLLDLKGDSDVRH